VKFKLRKFRKGDEKSLQENLNDKNIYISTGNIPHPYTIKDARSWVRMCVNNKEKKSCKHNLCIDIDGEVAGSLGFHNINFEKRSAEVGYWLAKKYWGKGIMVKAVRELLRIGFGKNKYVRIIAYTMDENKRSWRVLEKVGFKLEGKLRKYLLKDGKFYDARLYAKVR